jgi:hypothetical protein
MSDCIVYFLYYILAYIQILLSPLVTAAVAPLVIDITESFRVCFKVTILGWWRL